MASNNQFIHVFMLGPMIVCLLGVRYRDFYQLVPIVLQLVFLLSPILYRKANLGAMAWTANFNPLYHVLSPVRHSLMVGEVSGQCVFRCLPSICLVYSLPCVG